MQLEPVRGLPINVSTQRWKITSRTTQIALGLLWLLDGFLQLQPQMFGSHFVSGVIDPAARGQPLFVVGPMHLLAHIFLFHPAIFNSLAAMTQLALGALILNKRTTKIGLISSIGWGLFVWSIGEGYGGIFSGHSLLLMGAPGAALIYVILALAVMPRKSHRTAPRPPYWLAFVWVALWAGGAIYQLLPGQNSVSDLSSMIASNAAHQPGWLANLDYHAGSLINGLGRPLASQANIHMSAGQMATMQTQGESGYWFILLLALIQLGIGLAIFLPRLYRINVIIFGMIVSLVFWIIGQSFGGIFTGLATDPNSAILFILLGLAILGCNTLGSDMLRFFRRLEHRIT
jgi:hypothetical protein